MLHGLITLRGVIAVILSTPMSMYGAVAWFCCVWRGCCRLRLPCVTAWNCMLGSKVGIDRSGGGLVLNNGHITRNVLVFAMLLKLF
jgi:hypothetical protein